MADEAAALGQRGDQLFVERTGDAGGAVGAEDGLDAGKGVGLALGEELGSVGRLGPDHAADLCDGGQGIMGTFGMVND